MSDMSNPTPDGNSSTDLSPEGIEELQSDIERFKSNEEVILGALDDAKSLKIQGENQDLRNRLTAFSENYPDEFGLLAVAVNDNEEFFQIIEDEFSDEVYEMIRNLSTEYSVLADEIDIINLMRGSYRENIPTRGSLSVTHSYSNEEPIIDYTLYSGDLPVYEVRGEPSVFLHASRMFLDTATTGLEQAVEEESTINEEEIQSLGAMVDFLRERLADAEDLVQGIKGMQEQEFSDSETIGEQDE